MSGLLYVREPRTPKMAATAPPSYAKHIRYGVRVWGLGNDILGCFRLFTKKAAEVLVKGFRN